MSDSPSPAIAAPTHFAPAAYWPRFIYPVGVLGLVLANVGWWVAFSRQWFKPDSALASAPSTTLMFLLIGVAFLLVIGWPERSSARRAAAGLAGIAGILALHVLLASLLDQSPAWEIWLGPADTMVRGYRIGRMSDYAAILLLLSIFAFFALFVAGASRPFLAKAGLWIAGMTGVATLLLTLSYAAGNPLFASASGFTISPATAFGLLFLNAGFLLNAESTASFRHWLFARGALSDAASREQRWLVAVLVAAGLALVVAGVLFLSAQTDRQLQRTLDDMEAMSKLKVDQVAQWRRERIGDARSILATPDLEKFTRTVIAGNASARDRSRVAAWFATLRANFDYSSVLLLDAEMKPVVVEPAAVGSSPPTFRPPPPLQHEGGDVAELLPYVDRSGILHWDLLVPLRANDGAEAFGVILLETNLDRILLPIIRAWPQDNQTGQSMLWYRNDDKLYSLGGYRVLPDINPADLRPFGMVRSLADSAPQSFLTRAVRGEVASSGFGVDHRGVYVVGLAMPIPDSSWYISSRVDASEVYAPLRRYAMGAAGVVLGVLGMAGFVAFTLWQQRQKGLLTARLTAELEQKRLAARLGTVMQHARDIIFLADADLRLVDANQQAMETYGWSREEFLRMTIPDLRAPATRNGLPQVIERMLAPAGATFETEHIRRDGTTFPVEISSRVVELDGRSQIFAIVRDITDRQRAEQERNDYQARLHELAERLQQVREEESTRIARVVHDELGQQLTGVKMDLRWIERRLETLSDAGTGPVLDKVVAASALVDDTVRTVQRVAAELRPAILDQLGLVAALRHEASQFEQRAGLACRVVASKTIPPLSPELSTACYRIVQEALTNVARHAAATSVEIECGIGSDGLVIEVRDNGRGIVPSKPARVGSLGLLGMEERARALGGTVSIQPGRTGGTAVRASFPLQATLSKSP